MEDCVLIVDTNALSKRHLSLVNQLALAHNTAGAFVLFVQVVGPRTTVTEATRLKRLGFNFDELVILEESHKEFEDQAILAFADKTRRSMSSSVILLTGSGMVFSKALNMGMEVLLYG